MAGNEVSEPKTRSQARLVKRLRVGAYLGLVCGPILFGVGVYKYREVKGLRTKGITVEATVVDTSVLNTGKGRRAYKVVADYHPEGHPIHRKFFNVPEDQYNRARETGKISVTYLPAEPLVSAAGDEIHPPTELMAIGAGVFVVCLLIWTYFRRRQKALLAEVEELLQEPHAQAAGGLQEGDGPTR